MGFLKLRKPKTFSYSPRYYKQDKQGSPYQMKQKFDAYRRTIGGNKGLKQKFIDAFYDLKHHQDSGTTKRILLIVVLLVFIFLCIINFDLTIFFRK